MNWVKTIVFAAHDDGNGAFAVLCRIARALCLAAWRNGCSLRIYFLNSAAAEGGQARLDDAIRDTGPHEVVYVPVDNLLTIPKDPTSARVDTARIRPMLREKVRPHWPYWPSWAAWITRQWCREKGAEIHWHKLPDMTLEWWRGVDLGISMGVPQLHRRTREARIPSVELGDMFFSVVLSGCLMDEDTGGPSNTPVCPQLVDEPDFRMIADDEFLAHEAWLTLYQAPRAAYEEHLRNSGVPCCMMNGVLWTGDPPPANVDEWPLGFEMREALEADIVGLRGPATDPPPGVNPAGATIVYIMPGFTPVWEKIMEALRTRRMQQIDACAIVWFDRKRKELILLEGGDGRAFPGATSLARTIPDEAAHLAVASAADLCFARSAGGVLSAAQTHTPSVFVVEPGHWLGRIQKEQLAEADLCLVIEEGDGLEKFRDSPGDVIQQYAEKENDLAVCRDATRGFRVGAETELAQYLYDTYLRQGRFDA